jgi:hypothetical protein
MLPCINPTLVTSLAKISFAWRGSSKGGFDDAGGGFGDAAIGDAVEGLNSVSDTTTPQFVCAARTETPHWSPLESSYCGQFEYIEWDRRAMKQLGPTAQAGVSERVCSTRQRHDPPRHS